MKQGCNRPAGLKSATDDGRGGVSATGGIAAPVYAALLDMLAELEGNRLEVQLVPCRRPANCGGCVRVAVSKNAPWYRRFCAAYPSSRVRRNALFDTRIKRAATVKTLTRLMETGVSRSVYAPALMALARKRAFLAA